MHIPEDEQGRTSARIKEAVKENFDACTVGLHYDPVYKQTFCVIHGCKDEQQYVFSKPIDEFETVEDLILVANAGFRGDMVKLEE